MAAILFLLYFDAIGPLNIKFIGEVLINLAAILTLLSMAYYLRAAWPAMNGDK